MWGFLRRRVKIRGEIHLAKDEPTRSSLKTSTGHLGTFSGVFTPSILTILGIILFLRLGYVVGNAGLGRALLIIGVANAISILTTLSLSAVATNLKVKVGEGINGCHLWQAVFIFL